MRTVGSIERGRDRVGICYVGWFSGRRLGQRRHRAFGVSTRELSTPLHVLWKLH